MAENNVNVRIILKYDTETNWTANDPILKQGEIGICTSNSSVVRFKVGDGTSKYSVLPWCSALASDVAAWAKAANKPIYTANEISELNTFVNNQISAADLASASSVSAIQQTLTDAIEAETASLDATIEGTAINKTLATLSETDGIIAATFQDIAIPHTQISDFDTAIQSKFAYRMFKNLIGKNYLDESTIQDGYYGSSTSDWNTFSAEAGVKCVAIELDAGTYAMSCNINNTTAKFIRWAASGTVNVISGQPASFTFTLDTADKVYITWKSANSTYENMKTMIELGSTATAYEPYIPVPGAGGTTQVTSYTFLTPEQFGAKGDGVTNDIAALNQCIAQAKDTLTPIYGFGYYYIGTSTLNLHMNDVTFFANMIKSDNTDCAVNLQGKNNIIIINSIKSKGNGFVITTSPDRPLSLSNYIFLKYIQATNHCFYKYSHDNSVRITYNTFNFLNLGSSTGDCIRDYGGGGNNTYHGNNVYCYAENGYGLNLKDVSLSIFDAFVFENDVKCGILCDGSSQNTFTNIRNRELADRMKDNNDIYVIEFKGESYGNKFESRCDYIAVKNNVSSFNATKAQNLNDLNYWDDCLRFNGTNTLKLDRLIPYSYPSSDAATNYRPWTGTGEIITYYNHTGIKLDHDVYYDVTETEFKPYITNAYVPTVFNIKADTTITLNDMYFPLGIDKITIVQTDGKKAKVIDRHGTTIFDGTNKENGVYILRCITEENDTTTQFHGNCFCFTGENDEWIEELDISNKLDKVITQSADLSAFEIINSNSENEVTNTTVTMTYGGTVTIGCKNKKFGFTITGNPDTSSIPIRYNDSVIYINQTPQTIEPVLMTTDLIIDNSNGYLGGTFTFSDMITVMEVTPDKYYTQESLFVESNTAKLIDKNLKTTDFDITWQGSSSGSFQDTPNSNLNLQITYDSYPVILFPKGDLAGKEYNLEYNTNTSMGAPSMRIFTSAEDTTGTVIEVSSEHNNFYAGKIYKIEIQFRLNASINMTLKTTVLQMGLMSAEDKSNLNNLQNQVGNISTALDSILTIQNNLLGGNS